MSKSSYGELRPVGGGDPIPLIREVITIGRRESCDVCLKFPNISGQHCQLTYHEGHWIIRDLDSKNGVKVNGVRVQKKVLHPNDVISIAKKKFTIDYMPPVNKRIEELMEDEEDVFDQSLMQRAGLEKRRKKRLAMDDFEVDIDEDDDDDDDD
jgi:adenylate cyclase